MCWTENGLRLYRRTRDPPADEVGGPLGQRSLLYCCMSINSTFLATNLDGIVTLGLEAPQCPHLNMIEKEFVLV